MEIERDRRRDTNPINRRNRPSAAAADRQSASRRTGAVSSRAADSRSRTGIGRSERATPARPERTGTMRRERTAPAGRNRTDTRQREKSPSASRRQAGAGRYERQNSAGRLPAEAPETAGAAVRANPSRGRRKKKAKQSFLPFLLFILGLAVLGALVLGLMKLLFHNGESSFDQTRDGIAYLESLESKNLAEIDEELAAIRKKRIEVERDIILQKLTNDENDVWSMFHDYVILGDSRAVGFYYYDFLEKNRVLADGGDTIRKIQEHMDEIKALNPSYIFLCYGLNDVSIGYWSSPEEYTEEFMQICATLKQELPASRIIVSSILPARDPAFDISSLWREIPTYSDMLQAACEENDILFVDNSQTAEDHADLWDVDGIHVRSEFYSYWARNLIVAVIEDETYE